ncbi:VanW family protein [Bacillus sp. FJAT-49736]|uniref:VanW family protein n=1 Tax=Bacillus sp. FJAT-49736 TaxID=2833582 RepID=UPI001BC9615D|nr:VanW family protein [Bacillus sp. FJAT-49736]MBS4173043.1 VanW family protein [Bacillus sp. FJAT-49736]
MKILIALFIMSTYAIAENTINLTLEGKSLGAVQRSEFVLPPFDYSVINDEKMNHFLKQMEEKTYKNPMNATFNEKGALISEKPGYKLNKPKFMDMFYTAYFKSGPAAFEVPLQTIYPRVDSELLDNLREKRIGSYVTFFNSSNKERTHNIRLAANAINGHVVFPGETFSFNKIVGKRTVAKGYLPAPVIVRGELSEGVGGGICQVSSTLFNAVDKASVDITERYSHSRRVPYVPPNRDATVSWYGPDFKFKNPHNRPLLIRARVIGGQLFVVVLSSDEIIYKPKDIPSAPKRLPVEVNSKQKGEN